MPVIESKHGLKNAWVIEKERYEREEGPGGIIKAT